jgi:endo-1,4-beta-xylanase
MVSFSALLLVALVAAGAISAPADRYAGLFTLEKRQNPPSIGTHDGYYYNWWTDNNIMYRNLAGGSYLMQWTLEGGGNGFAGKGWQSPAFNR